MGFYLKLAWRNIFRNKRRTVITGIAIGIGFASLLFSDALIIGMKNLMIRSATASFMGEAQIYRAGFSDTMEPEKTIVNLDSVLMQLQREMEINRYTMRTLTQGMISSPANVSSAIVVGVNPQTERYLSQIADVTVKGNFFEGSGQQDVVIGDELAKILEVGFGDRIVITVAKAKTGELTQEMFRISGIYHFNMPELDKGMAFIRLEKSQAILGIGNNVHEIALKFENLSVASDKNLPLWAELSRYGNEARSWTELMPGLKSALDLTSYSVSILAVILFAIVALSIINSLFMSLYERLFEFGVMRAVGTRPSSIARLIVFESGSLAIVSIGFGLIIGVAVTAFFARFGIDYRGIEFSGVTVRDMLYPEFNIRQFTLFPIILMIFTMLISLYPARYAAKLSPSEAMRRSF